MSQFILSVPFPLLIMDALSSGPWSIYFRYVLLLSQDVIVLEASLSLSLWNHSNFN